MSKDEKVKFAELHETLPASPILDDDKKTIVFHGALYAFPDYTQEQLDRLIKSMESINKGERYEPLLKLIDRIAPNRVGPARTRRPGARVTRSKLRIETK